MARKEVSEGNLENDILGNNAALTCPLCGKVFIVSAFKPEWQDRLCPGCQKSNGHISKTIPYKAWIEY